MNIGTQVFKDDKPNNALKDSSAAFQKTTGHDASDEELMLAYAQGDMAAFESLYQKHKGSLYRYFCRQLSDLTLAQDLYQELWGRIIRSAQSYKVTAKWTTWVYTMAHNLVIDHVRTLKPVESLDDVNDQSSKKPSVNQTEPSSSAMHQPDHAEFNRQLSEQLKVCMGQLPQAQQDVFLLNEEAGMTLAAIADVVSISLEAAKSRLRYARKQLQECLSEYWQQVTTSGGRHD
ncbi:sigma-70 family RNA polymerase sigma factor [Litoribrevibacter euphylliae]|uniref:Sigma-70 family RNA polymerase sigma factor n=1 Tax=Litoribrevibacter euphylliae TaxID=1834034 RepID=A0ABV7HCB8_9GAMM